ncbi:XRE family transcriptional regulator [Lacticaseibacillus sharpeae JCM 1186 = DSM 20505]|uniref:XRE family transcriptional regulator n=2 Tax=Lacticaseibacillus sharpeae TaxID=1626 RepID=A0A0R1ZLK6_9LACO|nr:XRE family transcriptional regulator [Lacticaseibacillus sharpeae JCM 1186 = DSM 20505]
MNMENTIGSALRRIRKNRGESIVEVAKATHTSPASFTKWENEQNIPSERSVRKLAEYYDMEPQELLALAYPDKYAPKTAPEENVAADAIRVEDIIAPGTELSYNGKLVSEADKHLFAAFISGILLAKTE